MKYITCHLFFKNYVPVMMDKFNNYKYFCAELLGPDSNDIFRYTNTNSFFSHRLLFEYRTRFFKYGCPYVYIFNLW